jgi:hypothetical protein
MRRKGTIERLADGGFRIVIGPFVLENRTLTKTRETTVDEDGMILEFIRACGSPWRPRRKREGKAHAEAT